jgi:putative transposase
MPDHLHGLVAFPRQTSLVTTIRNWKHYLGRTCQVSWQRDFFEHRVRNNENWEQKAYYIRLNPVRAGLVSNAAEWPYIWEAPVGGK